MPCILASLLLASPGLAAQQVRPTRAAPLTPAPLLWNSGLAVRFGPSAFAGGAFAYLVGEEDQGRDLNGDGDLADRILHVVDPAEREVHVVPRAWTSTGFASSPSFGDYFALAVSEAGQGADLNADGDQSDRVLSVVEARSGLVRDLGLATESFFGARNILSVRSPFGDYDELGTLAVYDAAADRLTQLGRIGDGRVASTGLAVQYVDERSSLLDLNGDGDQLDTVVGLFDAAQGQVTNTGLPIRLSAASDHVAIQRDTLLVPVWESAQGVDLNGDGDRSDEILHEFELVGGALRNTGLDGHALIPSAALARSPEAAVYFIAAEDGRDWNGDGDGQDLLWVSRQADGVIAPFPGRLDDFGGFDPMHFGERFVAGYGYDSGTTHLVDTRRGVGADLKNPTFIDLRVLASPQLLATTTSEELLDEDLDGDGRRESFILHVHDLQRGASETLQRAVDVEFAFAFFTRIGLDGGLLAFASTELPGHDGNGDGDTRDSIVWLYSSAAARGGRSRWIDTRTSVRAHRTSDLPLYPRVGHPWVVWPVLESDEARDLDQDGTLDDEVLAAYHVPSQSLAFFPGAQPSTLEHWQLGLALAEASRGDLNGDGDTLDSVLHFVLAP